MNCTAASGSLLDWDQLGYLGDNPRLNLDDTDGYGPENINIDEPIAGQSYTVGVHYFSDDAMGPAQAYVKIYCGVSNVEPIYEVGPVELVERGVGLQRLEGRDGGVGRRRLCRGSARQHRPSQARVQR